MDIVCTIGLKGCNPETVFGLCEAGMSTARFNFSHMGYEKAELMLEYIRARHPGIKVVQDIQGHKLRVSKGFKGETQVSKGDVIYFSNSLSYGINKALQSVVVPMSLEADLSILGAADSLFLKDGTMKFAIDEIGYAGNNGLIKATAKNGGIIRAEKGINIPGMDRSKLRLTQKDKDDILWGLKHRVDIICLSYVCSAEIIKEMRDYIRDKGNGFLPKIWAKIENQEGVNHFKSILEQVDGIMLGRGDLCAEVDPMQVPKIQDDIVEAMKKSKKDLIIATHILPSMCMSREPSAAELDDIYSFIKNKVNGLMLASEVTVGNYPMLAVETLKKMIDKYEVIPTKK